MIFVRIYGICVIERHFINKLMQYIPIYIACKSQLHTISKRPLVYSCDFIATKFLIRNFVVTKPVMLVGRTTVQTDLLYKPLLTRIDKICPNTKFYTLLQHISGIDIIVFAHIVD